MSVLGVYFGEKHTYRDWKLRWTDVDVGYPEAKIFTIEVPGSSAVIDLTETLTGKVEYGTREIILKFETRERNYFEWEKLKSKIANYLHGKKMQIKLDTDPDNFYTGRVKVSFEKSEKERGEITITATCEPYKTDSEGVKSL